jgi:hypothetical protein
MSPRYHVRAQVQAGTLRSRQKAARLCIGVGLSPKPMKYYVRIGTDAPQVLTPEQIFLLIKEGKVTPQTKACAVGAAAWTELGQLLPALFAPDAKPPGEDHGAMEFVGKAGHFLAEHGGEVAGLAKTFARRIVVSNFVAEAALPEERAQLEKAAIPVKSPMAQNYAAWRRAILWFSGIGLGVAAIIQFIQGWAEMFGPAVPTVFRLLTLALNALQIAAPVLILMAACRWVDIKRSRKGARWGWLIQFFGPLLLFLLPMQNFSDAAEWFVYFQKMQGQEVDIATVKAQLALDPTSLAQMNQGMMIVFGAAALIILVPRIFGLFPGIIRACLTMRTLVPESPLPGSVAAVVVPLYTMFLTLALVVAAQVGTTLVFLGIACLVVSPILLLTNLRSLVKPMDEASMNAHVTSLRIKMSMVTLLGLVLLLISIGDYWKQVRFAQLGDDEPAPPPPTSPTILPPT